MYGWWHSRNYIPRRVTKSADYWWSTINIPKIKQFLFKMWIAGSLCRALSFTSCGSTPSSDTDNSSDTNDIPVTQPSHSNSEKSDPSKNIKIEKIKEENRKILSDPNFVSHLHQLIQTRKDLWWEKEQKIPISHNIVMQISKNAIFVYLVNGNGSYGFYLIPTKEAPWFSMEVKAWSPMSPETFNLIWKKLQQIDNKILEYVLEILNDSSLTDEIKWQVILTALMSSISQ